MFALASLVTLEMDQFVLMLMNALIEFAVRMPIVQI
jgi:hypothetical protein